MFTTHFLMSYLGISILVIFSFWFIFKKAGLKPVLSLLTVVPIVNLFMLYYVAFSKWPSRELERFGIIANR